MATYTHVGFRPHVGYAHCGARLWGHTTPRAGRRHAINREDHPQLGTRWRALCGEVVHDNRGRDEYGDAVAPNVRPADDPAAGKVTCKRCLRKVAADPPPSTAPVG